MRVLLDTNIIIHREASKVINPDIGVLFYWLDRLKLTKCIHPLTVDELNRHRDPNTVRTMNTKILNYTLLKTQAPLDEAIKQVSQKIDTTTNDFNDTQILNEIYSGRVDLLISEDNKIHSKASLLNISDKVFRIEAFLEKVTSENPDLIDYKVLAAKKVLFANVDIADAFFDTFKEDYQEFKQWFNKNADKECYVCYEGTQLSAFLYLKIEQEDENYSDITPQFKRKKRLKIGTFKVATNGFKIGERFLKIIFDNALQCRVNEIYVTVFEKRPEQKRLTALLEDWGFHLHGIKETGNGSENVYTREFGKDIKINIENPKLTYPFFSRDTGIYIIKIEPQYHTELFPDSKLTTEPANLYTENEPHRNAIRKVYVSHAEDRNLKSGDILVIYRMGETSPKKYSSTVTTICIVESVKNNIKSFEELQSICRKRTVISDGELRTRFWEKFPTYKPFVINFLYAHSFPTPKPTLNDLNVLGIIPDIMNIPRGFIKITRNQLDTLLNFIYNKRKD